jgi:glucose/galactose transporter
MSYFFLALPSAAILRRTGMKAGMVIGLLVMAAGAALFGQFATLRIFGGALAGLFVIGGGLALLQTAVNPYVSIVGPIESAAQRIAIMGICNKAAGILAPIVLGALVLHGIGDIDARVTAAPGEQAKAAILDGFAAKIYWPYLGMAGLLALLAIAVSRSPLPELRPGGDAPRVGRDFAGLFRHRHLWLGVLCLFLYVGVEVMAGDAIGPYGRALGLPLERTASFTSFTLTGMLAGYLVGLVVIPRYVSQERYLGWSALLGAALVIAATLTRGYVSIGLIAALGFANAMMWPAIFPLAVRDLGRHTETGSALLVMAICGGAIVPQLFAQLKQVLPFQLVFLAIMLASYVYIGFYGIIGSRVAAGLSPALAGTGATEEAAA